MKEPFMRRAVPVFLAALTLAGCQSAEVRQASRQANPAPCPNVFVLDTASRFVDFAGDERVLDAVTYSGEFDDVQTSCRYYADLPITARVDMALSVGRADASKAEVVRVPAFIAVTRTNRNVIEKQVFELPVRFKAGQRVASLTQTIDDIVIPRARAGTSGVNFEIAVGFQLTEQQYRFNRSDASLKFPDS
jgi:hypothetical protein